MRFLEKLYRNLMPSRYAHNKVLWPQIPIKREGPLGAIVGLRFHGRRIPVLPARTLKGRFQGTVHLVASGPSIRDVAWSDIRAGALLAMNGSICLIQFQGLRFGYYMVVDPSFIRNRWDIAELAFRQDLICFTTAFCMVEVLRRMPADHIRCRLVLIDNIAQRAHCPELSEAELRNRYSAADVCHFKDEQGAGRPLGFSLDLDAGLFDGATVAYWALQAVVYLGYDRIYLYGVDLSNADSAPRFYESEKDRLGSNLLGRFDTVIKPSFGQAARLLEGRGIRLFNTSPNSALDPALVPYVHWRRESDMPVVGGLD
jgi:Kdo-III transferase WaaZ